MKDIIYHTNPKKEKEEIIMPFLAKDGSEWMTMEEVDKRNAELKMQGFVFNTDSFKLALRYLLTNNKNTYTFFKNTYQRYLTLLNDLALAADLQSTVEEIFLSVPVEVREEELPEYNAIIDTLLKNEQARTKSSTNLTSTTR